MLGVEVSPVVQYVIAFAIIAALLALFAVVLKRIGGRRFALAGQDRGRARQPRLGIVDVYDLDRQRQLVLLRRDNVEHLVMLGGPNDLVVESNIVRVAPGRAQAPAASAVADFATERSAQAEIPFEPVAAAPVPPPRQPAEPAMSAAPARAQAQPPQSAPRPEPRPQERAPQPVPNASPAPAMERRGQAPEPAPTPTFVPAPAAPSPVSVSAPPAAPAQRRLDAAPGAQPATPSAEEPKRGLFGLGKVFEKALDRVTEKPAAPAYPPRPRATPVAAEAVPAFPVRRAPEPAPQTPSAQQIRPAPQDAPAPKVSSRPVPDVAPKPAAAVAPEPREPVAQSAAAAPQPRPSRAVDDAILSDMAKQLEAAFRQPGAPNRPAPNPAPTGAPTGATPAAPPRPVPSRSTPPEAFRPSGEFAPRTAPVTPATPVARPAPAPEPRAEPVDLSPFSLADIAPDTTEIPAPKPDAAQQDVAQQDVAPEASAPAPEPARNEPVRAEPAPAPEPAAEKPKVDPFSVDEIEAEFARLLGRSVEKDAKSS
ncbi:MAG: hypothetical protein MEP57_04575 [Microvirga sp.]|nr:hypothetical protein [Microvirga sp.]